MTGPTAPVRITHVITQLGFGGTERALFSLLQSLDHDRFVHEVVSLTPRTDLAPRLEELGVPLRVLRGRKTVTLTAAAVPLSLHLRKRRPDLVQTWMYHADLIGGLAARAAGVDRVIWSLHGGPLPPGGPRLAGRLGLRALARLSGSLPHRIVCCSHETRRIHKGMGYRDSKMVVISYGFEQVRRSSERTLLREELGIPQTAKTVGHVARLDPMKDHATMLDAFLRLRHRVPDAWLVLIGSDVSEDNMWLREQLAIRGLDGCVRMLGPRQDMLRCYCAFDVVALSSAFGECMPLVLGEAMSVGIPVVSTDVGGAAFLIDDASRIVSPRDPEALADRLGDILSADEETRVRLGGIDRERVRTHFSIEKMVDSYEQVYAEALTGPREPKRPISLDSIE